MVTFSVEIDWSRNGAAFVDGQYSRVHRWNLDGGMEIMASSSPHIVPVPYSDPAAVDPEEAYVASLSSCHMLWFLSIAAKRGFRVNRYHDAAVGQMSKNEQGKLYVHTVRLRPHIDWDSPAPSAAEVEEMHQAAHAECFIANSVLTAIIIETPS